MPGKGFTGAVRSLRPAANPMAAGMLMQTMAVQVQLQQLGALLDLEDQSLRW